MNQLSTRLAVWTVVVMATTAAICMGIAGFAEPHESTFSLMVWAILSSIVLHAGLLGGLLGWKSLRSQAVRIVIGVLMLPATLLAETLVIGTLKKLNWIASAASFLMFCIYVTVWIRLLGGWVLSMRQE